MLAKEARPATPSACDQAGLTCLTSGRAVRGSERARAGPRLAPTALVPAPKRDTGPACLRALTTGYARNGHDMTASRDSAIRRLGALPTRDCHHARQPAAERPSSRLRAVDTQAVPAGQHADGQSGPLQTASRGDHVRSTAG